MVENGLNRIKTIRAIPITMFLLFTKSNLNLLILNFVNQINNTDNISVSTIEYTAPGNCHFNIKKYVLITKNMLLADSINRNFPK